MATKYDPLEDAKVTDSENTKVFGKRKKKKSEDAPPPPPPEPVAVEKSEPVAAPPPAPAPRVKSDRDLTKKYRVVKDKMVSINGSVTKIRAGTVIEARFYGGPVGLSRILEQVEVEEC